MDSGFDKNQSEFAVLISSMFLDMLSNVNGFLDQVIQVLWEGWSDSTNLKNSQNLRSSNTFNLRNTVLISEENTDL